MPPRSVRTSIWKAGLLVEGLLKQEKLISMINANPYVMIFLFIISQGQEPGVGFIHLIFPLAHLTVPPVRKLFFPLLRQQNTIQPDPFRERIASYPILA